jgi:enoyl-CoA hydratase/carnithine racemase
MSFVLYDVQDRIATIRFNRPERLNAYGYQLRQDYYEAFVRFEKDADADVAIICGAGKAFCAGRDMKEEAERGTTLSQHRLPEEEWHSYLHVKLIDKPVIAAVHGYCLGVGARVALGCDYRIATSDSSWEISHVATGRVGAWDIPIFQLIPWAVAGELIYLDRRIHPQRLYDVGIVNEVVEPGMHETRARDVAREFLKQPQGALRATKRMMNLARFQVPRELDEMKWTMESQGDSRERLEGLERFAERKSRD